MASYDEVILSSGESWTRDLGSGDVVENVLVDVSAPGADFHIGASGTGWEIRNVGVRGALDVSADEGGSSYNTAIDCRGNGLIENVYLGDGCVDGVARGGLASHYTHSGSIDIRNTYVAYWSGNGCYFGGTGRVGGSSPGGGGNHHFENCYLANNNISHARVTADGTTFNNCTFVNDDTLPDHPGAGTDGTGIYTGYGEPSQVIEVRNCDFATQPYNAAASGTHSRWGPLSTIDIYNSEIEGGNSALSGGYVNWHSGGTNPDPSVPAQCPASAKEAASAGTTPCGSDADCPAGQKCEGGECVPIEPGELPHGLKIKGNGTVTNYRICSTGPMVEDPALGAFEQKHDGVEGQCVNGWVTNPEHEDGVAFDGTIDTVEWVKGEADLILNGQQMTRQEVLNWDPNAPKDDGPKEEPKQGSIGATGVLALGLAGAYLYSRYNNGGY